MFYYIIAKRVEQQQPRQIRWLYLSSTISVRYILETTHNTIFINYRIKKVFQHWKRFVYIKKYRNIRSILYREIHGIFPPRNYTSGVSYR